MATRVVLGKRANNDYGLFISKANQDANSASNENLIFNTASSSTFSLKTLQLFATANAASSSSTVTSTAVAENASNGSATANTAVGNKLIVKGYGNDLVPLQNYTGSSLTLVRGDIDNRGFDAISGLGYANSNDQQNYIAITTLV